MRRSKDFYMIIHFVCWVFTVFCARKSEIFFLSETKKDWFFGCKRERDLLFKLKIGFKKKNILQKCEKKPPKSKFERVVVFECVARCWHFFHLRWKYFAQIELDTENWMPECWTYTTLYMFVCALLCYIETKNIHNNTL